MIKREKSNLFIFLLVFAFLTFLFSSCSAPNAKDSIENSLKARIQSEIITGDDLPLFIQYRNAVYNSIRFHVDKVNETDNTATVTFNYVLLDHLIEQYSANSSDAESFYQSCIQALQHNAVELTEETINIEYSENGTSLIISDSASFLSILSGGSLQEFQSFISGD